MAWIMNDIGDAVAVVGRETNGLVKAREQLEEVLAKSFNSGVETVTLMNMKAALVELATAIGILRATQATLLDCKDDAALFQVFTEVQASRVGWS